jgi:hypothetical protein
MPIVQTFPVVTEGIGRVDYSLTVERSTATFYTPALRQQIYTASYRGTLPTLPPGWVYAVVVPMPQEDGSWWYEASSIAMHLMEVSLAIHTNCLVRTGSFRYASLANYYAGIIAQRFITIYGYGQACVELKMGIPTQPGSVYTIALGFYSPHPTEYFTLDVSGLMTDLTRPWM